MLSLRHYLAVILAGMSLLPPIGSAQPATQPAAPEQPAAPRRVKIRPKLPNLGTMPIQRIVGLNLEDGALFLTTDLPRTPDRSKVQLEGRGGFTTIHIMGEVENGTPARHYDFQHYDFARPGVMSVMTQVQGTVINLQISQSIEWLGGFQMVQLIQSNRMPAHRADEKENGVRLYVQSYDSLRNQELQEITLWAPNLAELRQRYPKQTSRYVQPIFRDLGRPDLFAIEPAVAWQVFSESFSPDPQLKQQVEQLVARLDAESFADRERAFEQLKELGQPAAAILTETDRSNLSNEQIGRIELLTKDVAVGDGGAQSLRRDYAFLLDCLYCTDPKIRQLALEQLEKNLSRQIELDVNSVDSPKYRSTVEQLRSELFPPVPATRPVKK